VTVTNLQVFSCPREEEHFAGIAQDIAVQDSFSDERGEAVYNIEVKYQPINEHLGNWEKEIQENEEEIE
jgi:hypothetical protein